MVEHLPLFILLSVFAEILGTIGGFGSSMFFIPIATYFLDFHSALGITAIFHVSSNITKIIFFKKGFNKELVIKLGIPATLFVIIGAYLSKFIDSKSLEIGLAIFLMSISTFLLLNQKFELKPTTGNAIGGGVLSGLIAGIIGTGGAIRGITMAAFNLKTEAFIATSAIIDLAIDSSRGVMYYLNGYVHSHDLYLIPILFVVSIVGTYIGKLILTKISEDQFKKIVLVLIFITGIITILKLFVPISI